MARAYLKINVTPGMEITVRDAIRRVKGILSADVTTGEQDIICLVEAPSYDSLLGTVMSKLRRIEGIERTATNFVIE